MNRYIRQINLPNVGDSGQKKLRDSQILVIGAGGLGCAVLPYLAAAGVGRIGIIDGDKIEESNLHRQVLYGPHQIGSYKSKIAAESIIKNNPDVEVLVYEEYLSSKNSEKIFQGFDLIIDATDNLFIRYVINDTCLALGIPFVYGSIHQFQGQVSVFNYQGGPSYRDIFPDENQTVPNCAEAGVLGTTVGLIGMLQANEAIKIILEIGDVLSGKLLIYDMLSHSQQVFEFGNAPKKEKKENSNSFESLNPEEALVGDAILLDVREKGEVPVIEFANSISMPLSLMESESNKLDKEAEIRIFCQSGARSRKAAELLSKKGFQNLKLIRGGAKDLLQLTKNEKSIS
ncbi:HesA/MoeB/ThiF family protein [Algoriphagus machipongonensis]|uniref:Molybdopterin-synthase adenylyltransferase n=1 Tax=Algoriphagus machipongonensis TaxID=388413 RepID=E2RUD3_9BACT|nr:HesA/MoeB/ThiF family protein [Algoriphagus machipongonensis]EFQ79214.1 putative molybdopterin biosynthesis protein MoeB [Algoriphagus machipongonensis]